MAAPSYVAGTTQDFAGAQSLTFTIPAAATTDDFMIAFVKQSENTGAQVWDDDGGGGNGWTREAYNRTTSGRDQETAVYTKFHSGSETNPTFTWNSGGTNEPMSGILLVYRGVDKIDPFTQVTYLSGSNDCNPPNAAVQVTAINTKVVCFHAATHDDISSVGAPTGFTIRDYVYGGSAGHTNDHRDCFSADIEVDTIATYSPPDWTHGASNNTPEWHCYSIALNEAKNIHVTGGTALDGFFWGDVNLTITGDGFEATKNTGKVEIWSDTVGTIKTEQTTDSWAAGSIQFDTVQGSLPNNTTLYIVVTNNTGDVSSPIPISVGLINYQEAITSILKPDHYWVFNNVYDDTGITGPSRPFNSGVAGTWSFNTQNIVDGNTHSLNYSSKTNRRETADSPNMNITITSAERTLCMWIQLNEVQHDLACIWKEGGGVQNLAFMVGYGNVLMFQGADTPGNAINAQSYSDFRLNTGRPYNIVGRYSLTESPKELRLYIDGVEMSASDGNPLGTGSFNSHSGDNTLGDPDTNLETGGTDIAYNTLANAQISDFITFSDNSTGVNAGALAKDSDIRDIVFRRGAVPYDTITSDSAGGMQSLLDSSDDIRVDWPLSYRIDEVDSGSAFELIMNNKVFDDRITDHLEYRGSGTLTVVNALGSNFDVNKSWSATGGNINVVNEVEVKVTVKDILTDSAISGARVLVEADTGGDLTVGDDILTGYTDSVGELSGAIRYTSDQPLKGWVRKGSSAPFYKQSLVSGTITTNGVSLNQFMIRD